MSDRLKIMEALYGVNDNNDGIWDTHNLGEYADAIIKEGFFRPPCKVGDEVWCLPANNGIMQLPKKGVVSQMCFTDEMRILIVVKHIGRGFWGDRVFQTREDALMNMEERYRKAYLLCTNELNAEKGKGGSENDS